MLTAITFLICGVAPEKLPWQVPLTPTGRQTLERLAMKYSGEGKEYELGCTLSQLSRVYFQIGTGDPKKSVFVAAAQTADRAIEMLSRCHDKRALALAFRRSALPFRPGREARLNRAMELYRQTGSDKGVAWCQYNLLPPNASPSKLGEVRRLFVLAHEEKGALCIDLRKATRACDFDRAWNTGRGFWKLKELSLAGHAYGCASVYYDARVSKTRARAFYREAQSLETALGQRVLFESARAKLKRLH